MIRKQFFTSTVAIVGAIGLTMSLTGCSSSAGDDSASGTTDSATAAAVDPTDAATPDPADEPAEATTDGSGDVGSGGIPEGFPSEVPLVSTDVLDTSEIDRGNYVLYTVTVADGRSPAEVLDALPADFADWGLTFSDDTTSQFTSNDLGFSVTVTVTAGDSAGSSVEYDVPVPAK